MSTKSLQKPQPFSGKLESTLDYMRDRGTAELWGWNVGDWRKWSVKQSSFSTGILLSTVDEFPAFHLVCHHDFQARAFASPSTVEL